jgi:hypothetical protein
MQKIGRPWITLTIIMSMPLIGWVLWIGKVQIVYFIVGLLSGILSEMIIIFKRRRNISDYVVWTLAILYVLAGILSAVIKEMFGFMVGLVLPLTISIYFYQLIFRNNLSWDDIRRQFRSDT